MSTAATKAGERFPPLPDNGGLPFDAHWRREGYATCYTEEVEPRDATIAELRSEVEEQARLLGAGASREAALMAEVDRLKKVAQVACDALDKVDKEMNVWWKESPFDPSFPSVKQEVTSALSQLAENGITPSK